MNQSQLHFYLIFILCPFFSNQLVLAELVEMEISTSATLAQEVRSRVSPVWFLGLQHSSLCPSADSCFCCQELEKKAFYHLLRFIRLFSVTNCRLIMSAFRLFHPCQTLSPCFQSKFQLLTGKHFCESKLRSVAYNVS